jgi:RNA polymerase sigma-70 factor (ECF subfamily)
VNQGAGGTELGRVLPHADPPAPAAASTPEAVLADFYEQDYPPLVAAIALMGTDTADACDIVDDAVAAAWQEGAAAGGQELFTSFVRTRALSSARRGVRRRLLERRATRRLREEQREDVDRAIEGALALDVQRVLETLSRRQREVVVLHYMFDMPVEAVAHELGVSQSTVKTMLHRARLLLTRRLAEGES